jgi:chemotaxis response regulator CheB
LPLPVREVSAATLLEPCMAYLAQGDSDVLVSRRGTRIFATPAPADPAYPWRPSVDRMAQSAVRQISAIVAMAARGSLGARVDLDQSSGALREGSRSA